MEVSWNGQIIYFNRMFHFFTIQLWELHHDSGNPEIFIQFQGMRASNLRKMGELREIWAQNLPRHGHVCVLQRGSTVAGSIPFHSWVTCQGAKYSGWSNTGMYIRAFQWPKQWSSKIPLKKWCHRISLPYFAGSLTTSVNKKHHIRLGGDWCTAGSGVIAVGFGIMD